MSEEWRWVQPILRAGDVAFHSAGALHGVTRVRRGERYSLVAFFESTLAGAGAEVFLYEFLRGH